MMIRTLAAGVALAVLMSGAASAAPQAKASAAAAPKQPIPYSQLDAYLKASPKTRATKDWWSGSASTGMSTDTSATMPAASTTTDTSVAPSTDTSVNPPAPSTTMPSDSGMSPPATPPILPEGSNPAPGSNLPGSGTTPGAPIEQK
jgi:molybdate transport system ATP-binding protein